MNPIDRFRRSREYGSPGKVKTVIVTTPWVRDDGSKVRTQVHEALADRFSLACVLAAQNCPWWRPQRAEGYVNRLIRDRLVPSMHAYGLAIDFFTTAPNVPPPGGVWWPHDTMPLQFAAPFLQLGFSWGATWISRKDAPHMEFTGSITDARVNWSALKAA